jgi:hypothetical protein
MVNTVLTDPLGGAGGLGEGDAIGAGDEHHRGVCRSVRAATAAS